MQIQDSCQIMVVDDDPVARSVAKTSLERAVSSADIHTFETAPAAIEACKIIQPSLVLLDLELPGMGGLEAAPILRTKIGDVIPIIVITASQDISSVHALMRAGAVTDVVEKPLNVQCLQKLIENYIRLPRVPEEAGEDIGAGLAERFQARLETVEKAVERFMYTSNGANFGAGSEQVHALREHIHKLAGSSGLFGYAELGEMASGVEEAVADYQRNRGDSEAGLLCGRLDTLSAEIAKCRVHIALTAGK